MVFSVIVYTTLHSHLLRSASQRLAFVWNAIGILTVLVCTHVRSETSIDDNASVLLIFPFAECSQVGKSCFHNKFVYIYDRHVFVHTTTFPVK